MDSKRLNRRPSVRDRRRSLTQATAARRRLDEYARPARGRAWINGAEVGGASARFEHLGRSYD